MVVSACAEDKQACLYVTAACACVFKGQAHFLNNISKPDNRGSTVLYEFCKRALANASRHVFAFVQKY